MKTVWCKIIDGDSIVICSTKRKALSRIKDGNPDMTNDEAKEILETYWQEVYVD